MIKIGVCEDQEVWIKHISSLLEIELTHLEIAYDLEIYTSGINFLKDYKKKSQSFDVIFLDVQMPGMNGFEVAKHIRSKDQEVVIVFLTMMEGLVYEAFGYNAYKFILKSEKEWYISKQLKDCILHTLSAHKYYFFETPEGVVKVRESEIVYFERVGRKFLLHTIGEKYFLRIDKFEEILDKLRYHPLFLMPNRYTVINMRHVIEVKKDNELTLKVGNECADIAISRGRKKEIYDAFIHNI